MTSLLCSKKGECTLAVVSVIMALLMVLSLLFVYAKALTMAESVAEEVRFYLSEEIVKASQEKYGSLKDGVTESMKSELGEISRGLACYLGVEEEGEVIRRDSYGEEIYRLAELEVKEEENMKLVATYLLRLPIRIGRETYGYADVPMTIRVYYVNEEK